MLLARDISYTYPGTRRGIAHLSLVAQGGAITALKGSSGSGKSTLLACIAGVLTPDSGTVTFADGGTAGPGRGASPPERPCKALILQNCALFEHLSVWENVALGRGVPRPALRDRALDELAALGVSDLADVPPSALSLGQRQRVAIAAALAMDAQVLLADEPTGSLDASNASRVLAALRVAARRGAAVVIASHDAAVWEFADGVVDISSADSLPISPKEVL